MKSKDEKNHTLVVLLKGVNVGGHKTFKPSLLAERLSHLKLKNIGAAGTFVVSQPVSQSQLRKELAKSLPFETEVFICQGLDIMDLISENPFISMQVNPDQVFFVGLLSDHPRLDPDMPLDIPTNDPWLIKILDRKGKFFFGVYKRQIKAIGYLNKLERIFGTSVTVRNWNTIRAIAKILTHTE